MTRAVPVVVLSQIVILGQERAQLAKAAGDDFEDRLIGIRRHFLFEMGDAQRFHAPDVAFVRHRHAGDHAKQRRLAGAVATDETDSLAGIDLKVDVRQQR